MSQAQTFYEGHSYYEGLTWWFVREQIGHSLGIMIAGLSTMFGVSFQPFTKFWSVAGNRQR